MKKFKNLKLKTKQVIGFGLVLTIMAAANFYSVHKMELLKEEIDEVSNNWLPQALSLAEIKLNTSYLRISQLQHAITADSTLKDQHAKKWISFIDEIIASQDIYDSLRVDSEIQHFNLEEENKLISDLDDQFGEYQELSNTYYSL